MTTSTTRLRKPLHPIAADEFGDAGIDLESNAARMATAWTKAYGVSPQGVMDLLGNGVKGPMSVSLSMDQPGEFDGELSLDSGATASFRLRPDDKAVDVLDIDSEAGPEQKQLMANLTTLARSLGAESMTVNSNTNDAGAQLAAMGAEPTEDTKDQIVAGMNKHLRGATGIPVETRNTLQATLAGESPDMGKLYDQAKAAGVTGKVFDRNGVGNESWQGRIDLTDGAKLARVDAALTGAKPFSTPTPHAEPVAPAPTAPKLTV